MEDSIDLKGVNAAYTKVCAEIGDAFFRIKLNEEFIDSKMPELKELNQKAIELKNAATEVPHG